MATTLVDQHKPQVQPLDAAHLEQALALSQALQWPYRLEDWQFALALGRGIAVEIDGRLAGTALWWPYGEAFASAGMIIVAAQAQRRGIGAALMSELLRQTAGRTVILNSTAEGLALYTRLGFVADGGVHQHQAVLRQAPGAAAAEMIRDLQHEDVPFIHRLDASASGMDRSELVSALFDIGSARVLERNGAPAGYGCLRRWGRGVVIGPVIAPDADGARALIADIAADQVGQFVRIDVIRRSGLSSWLDRIGLPQVGEVTSMALGDAPAPQEHAVLFALSNQSLG